MQCRQVSTQPRHSHYMGATRLRKRLEPLQGIFLPGHHSLRTHRSPGATSRSVERIASQHTAHCRCAHTVILKMFQWGLGIRCLEPTHSKLLRCRRRGLMAQELSHSLLMATSNIHHLHTVNTKQLICHERSQVRLTTRRGTPPLLNHKAAPIITRILLYKPGCISICLLHNTPVIHRGVVILQDQGILCKLIPRLATRINGRLQLQLPRVQRRPTPSLSAVPGHRHHRPLDHNNRLVTNDRIHCVCFITWWS